MKNSNEKIAMMQNGMEGTGNHFTVNGQSAEELLAQEQLQRHNQKVNQYVEKLDNYNQALEDYAAHVSEGIEGMEIMPMFGYVLVKPFAKNPFQTIKTSAAGVITDLGGYAPEYKSNETGDYEEEQQYIRVGSVVEVGHKVEFLKPGDVVMYTIASEAPVPFFKQGFVTVAENRVMAVINSGLTERRNNVKNGTNG